MRPISSGVQMRILYIFLQFLLARVSHSYCVWRALQRAHVTGRAGHVYAPCAHVISRADHVRAFCPTTPRLSTVYAGPRRGPGPCSGRGCPRQPRPVQRPIRGQPECNNVETRVNTLHTPR